MNHTQRFKPRFELGQIIATPGALAACSNVFMQRCLARHVTGDWGHVGSQDALQNEAALSEAWPIMSAYGIDPTKPCKSFGENRLWIVTEADRSATTLLLPDEYANHRRRASRPSVSTQTEGDLS
jgi:hypothetical protein